MKTTLIATIIALLITQVAEARLSETYEQCVKRYGPLREKLGDPKNPQFIFEKDGITVGINFLNGKAAQISYRKRDFFVDAEVQRLLEVNSGGSTWRYNAAETQRQLVPNMYSKQEYFTREDGGAFAEHASSRTGVDFVTVQSAEYKKAISSRQFQGF